MLLCGKFWSWGCRKALGADEGTDLLAMIGNTVVDTDDLSAVSGA